MKPSVLIRTLRWLPLLAALLCVHTAAAQADGSNNYIRLVENGLQPSAILPGRQIPRGLPLKPRMAYHQVPGMVVAVVNNYQIDWVKGYGVLQDGRDEQVNAGSLFQAPGASMAVAALAANRVLESSYLDGKVDVLTMLQKLKWPSSAGSLNNVSIRRLLSHTAGLDGTYAPRGYMPGSKQMPDLAFAIRNAALGDKPRLYMAHTPGQYHVYSPGGYGLMQLALEDFAGEGYADIARKNVLQPLGLRASCIGPPEKGMKYAYAHGAKGRPLDVSYYQYPDLAASGLWSTGGDLARLLIEVQLTLDSLSANVVSPAYLRQMMQPLAANACQGFYLYGPDAPKAFFQYGCYGGYTCFWGGTMQGGKGVVILLNADHQGAWLLMNEVLRSVALAYNWPCYKPDFARRADKEKMARLVGMYDFGNGNIFRVETDINGDLYLLSPSERRHYQLYQLAEGIYTIEAENVRIRFVLEKSGRVEMFMTERLVEYRAERK